MPHLRRSFGLSLAACLVAVSAHATVTVSNTGTAAPTTDAADQFYLPGSVNEVDAINVDGTNNNSAENDGFTYIANDRASKGMTFTTGTNSAGYTLGSITVQQVNWSVYLSNGTYYNIQNGDTFDLRIGTVSGTTLTSLLTTTATYSGTALVNGTNSSGPGNYLQFDLTGATEQAALGTLSANTVYFFEIASGSGDPYFELNSTSADGYSFGQSFVGGTISAVDADNTITFASGDFAFVADLTAVSAIPEPSTYAAIFGAVSLLGVVAFRRRKTIG